MPAYYWGGLTADRTFEHDYAYLDSAPQHVTDDTSRGWVYVNSEKLGRALVQGGLANRQGSESIAEDEKPVRSTIASERRCEDWLQQLMRTGPPEQTKQGYLGQAQEKFAVSRRGFVRAWANSIVATGNQEWRKPGRKS